MKNEILCTYIYFMYNYDNLLCECDHANRLRSHRKLLKLNVRNKKLKPKN